MDGLGGHPKNRCALLDNEPSDDPRWVSSEGTTKESTTEDLSQGLCDPTNLKIIQLCPQLKPNFFEAANSISFRS